MRQGNDNLNHNININEFNLLLHYVMLLKTQSQ